MDIFAITKVNILSKKTISDLDSLKEKISTMYSVDVFTSEQYLELISMIDKRKETLNSSSISGVIGGTTEE